jgi:hypothetical protein
MVRQPACPRSTATRLAFAGLVALAAAAVVACGGEEGTGVTPTAVPATATQSVSASPAELGRQIGDLYVRAMSEVTEMLRDQPPAADAQASVRDLKETYVRQLVELGRTRESLDAQGRAAVDAAISVKVNAVGNEPWYATYGSLAQHYITQDREFYDLVVSFNIITQYANFDLLKSQEPEEAKRLGIE